MHKDHCTTLYAFTNAKVQELLAVGMSKLHCSIQTSSKTLVFVQSVYAHVYFACSPEWRVAFLATPYLSPPMVAATWVPWPRQSSEDSGVESLKTEKACRALVPVRPVVGSYWNSM